MRITQQLVLVPLTIFSPLAFTAYSMSHESSVTNAPAVLGRDDTANYVVYPKDTKNKDQAKAIYDLLKSLAPNPTAIYSATTDNGTQHWFWAVPLTSVNAEKVKGDSNVRMGSHSLSNNARTDESRSLQSLKNAHRIVTIQRKAMTSPAPNEGAQTMILITQKNLASRSETGRLSMRTT